MAFSLQNNPYFSASNPSSLVDIVELRHNLASRFFGRIPTSQDYEAALSQIASQSPDLLRRKPFCIPNTLLNSPGWFQHALASSLQMGLLPLPRCVLKDFCVPPIPPQPLGLRLPRTQNVPSPFEATIPEVKPKGVNKMPPRAEQLRPSLNDNNNPSPLIPRQPIFRPTLKRNADKPKTNWRSLNNTNLPVTADTPDTGSLVPSLIDGEVIMGFNVWGEKRLCLPHLFRFVLHDVDLQVIDEACTKLQITCTTCSPGQLNLLHARKILPRAVGSCGLIRKSDAERLTKYIRHRSTYIKNLKTPNDTMDHISAINSQMDGEHRARTPNSCDLRQVSPLSTETAKSSGSDYIQDENQSELNLTNNADSNLIPVIHECFGRQLGIVYPDMYAEPNSKCIKCITCYHYFSPEQFVGHTHTVTEVDNLNHWGFDSTNWRCYLRLYTGRRLNLNSCKPLSNGQNITNESFVNVKRDVNESASAIDTYHRLEKFKIKFAQPIKLPSSLSAALRSVGLCASVAPIPPGSSTTTNNKRNTGSDSNSTEQLSKFHLSKTQLTPSITPQQIKPNKQAEQTFTFTETSTTSSISTSSTPCNFLLPQLTLRRLWAPNDGRIKLPPPPKLLTNCELKSVPEKLQTGPPLLLHSHRVVTRDAADQYDRDFIPNVCLKPCNEYEAKKFGNSSCGRRRRRHKRDKKAECEETQFDWNRCSRSRSHSEYSSGSRSSRTRSSSGSSSRSSRGSCHNRIRSSSNNLSDPSWAQTIPNKELIKPHGIVSTRSSRCNQWNNFDASLQQRSASSITPLNSDVHNQFPCESAHLLSSSQSLSSRLQRPRSHTPKVCLPSKPIKRSASCPMVCPDKKLSNVTNLMKGKLDRRKNANPTSFEALSGRSTSSISNKYIKQRFKALAAARAAQGAASRACPGLWVRHFSKIQNSNSESMNLPNARRKFDVSAESAMSTQNTYATPVLVTNPMKNSLPAAVLALESIWADLVRHINEYTVAIESRSGVESARQRLFEQFISMQTCYATHIASLMDENQKLNEQLTQLQSQFFLYQPHLQSLVKQQQQKLQLQAQNLKFDVESLQAVSDCNRLSRTCSSPCMDLSRKNVAPSSASLNLQDIEMDENCSPNHLLHENMKHLTPLNLKRKSVNLDTMDCNDNNNHNSSKNLTNRINRCYNNSLSEFDESQTNSLSYTNHNSPFERHSQSSSTPTASETEVFNKDSHDDDDDNNNNSNNNNNNNDIEKVDSISVVIDENSNNNLSQEYKDLDQLVEHDQLLLLSSQSVAATVTQTVSISSKSKQIMPTQNSSLNECCTSTGISSWLKPHNRSAVIWECKQKNKITTSTPNTNMNTLYTRTIDSNNNNNNNNNNNKSNFDERENTQQFHSSYSNPTRFPSTPIYTHQPKKRRTFNNIVPLSLNNNNSSNDNNKSNDGDQNKRSN